MPARKRSQSVGRTKTRRRARVIGLGTGASAFLALGLSPLAAAPAHADEFGFDSIIDPIVTSLTHLDPALSMGLDHGAESRDATLGTMSSADPTTGLDSALTAASSSDTVGSFWQGLQQDWLGSTFGGHVDTALNSWWLEHTNAAAASSTDTSGTFAQGLQQEWINSNFGQHVDNYLNTWYLDHAHSAASTDSCGVICNG